MVPKGHATANIKQGGSWEHLCHKTDFQYDLLQSTLRGSLFGDFFIFWKKKENRGEGNKADPQRPLTKKRVLP